MIVCSLQTISPEKRVLDHASDVVQNPGAMTTFTPDGQYYAYSYFDGLSQLYFVEGLR